VLLETQGTAFPLALWAIHPAKWRFCVTRYRYGPLPHTGCTRLYHEFASMSMPFVSLRRGHEGRTQGATPVSHAIIELCLMMTARVTQCVTTWVFINLTER